MYALHSNHLKLHVNLEIYFYLEEMEILNLYKELLLDQNMVLNIN